MSLLCVSNRLQEYAFSRLYECTGLDLNNVLPSFDMGSCNGWQYLSEKKLTFVQNILYIT